jgi:aminopeptidase N
VGYNKGAAVLHMVRRLLGDDDFLASLRRFQAARAGRASNWRDYQEAAEQASNRHLRWFFDQWLDRPGLPTVSLEDFRVTPSPNGQWEACFTVRQEGEPYRLILPLEFTLPGADPVQATVEVRRDREPVRIRLPARPIRVRLDPQGDLLLGREQREWEFPTAAPSPGGT